MSYLQYPSLTFDEANHEYRWLNARKPSVTQVLSSVGVKQQSGEFVGICDNQWCQNETAANFGTSFHKAAAIIMRGNSVTVPPELEPWVDQFHRWRRDHSWLAPMSDENGKLLVEYMMYHEILGFAGTPDLIALAGPEAPALFRNSVVVIDWKTSTSELSHWAYQCAAYAEMAQRLFGITKKIITMTVLFKEDSFKTKTNFKYASDWTVFLSALNIYKTQRGNE